MDKRSLFDASEILENIDPIQAAEDQLGKRWEEFDDIERLSLLRNVAKFNQAKHALNDTIGDTYMGCPISRVEDVLTGTGFQIGWMAERIGEYGHNEKEVIWCNPNGIVVYVDSFMGKSTNRVDLYAEFIPSTDDELFREQCDKLYRSVSNGGSCGLFPYELDTPKEKKRFEVQADGRTGLRRKLLLLNETADTNPVWENTTKHTWFVNYTEEKKGWDIDNKGILKRKLQNASPMLKSIMRIFM